MKYRLSPREIPRPNIFPAEDSGSGALGNTLCLEGNIATAIFVFVYFCDKSQG